MTEKDDLSRLFRVDDPADADADYYARHHAGSVVHVARDGDAAGAIVHAAGFLGPVAVLRADHARVLPLLLAHAPRGSRYVKTTAALADGLVAAVRVESPVRMRVAWLPHGAPPPPVLVPAEIVVGNSEASVLVDQVRASRCRVIWRSTRFAEVAIETEPAFRRRGFGRAAVAAMSSLLLREGVAPIYVTDVRNVASLRLAAGLGFVACGEEFAGHVEL